MQSSSSFNSAAQFFEPALHWLIDLRASHRAGEERTKLFSGDLGTSNFLLLTMTVIRFSPAAGTFCRCGWTPGEVGCLRLLIVREKAEEMSGAEKRGALELQA
jgi:hypothetical protein